MKESVVNLEKKFHRSVYSTRHLNLSVLNIRDKISTSVNPSFCSSLYGFQCSMNCRRDLTLSQGLLLHSGPPTLFCHLRFGIYAVTHVSLVDYVKARTLIQTESLISYHLSSGQITLKVDPDTLCYL